VRLLVAHEWRPDFAALTLRVSTGCSPRFDVEDFLMRRFALVVAVSLLAHGVANAADVLITGSGTFGDSAPTTDLSAPGDTWSFSFDVSSPVTPVTAVSVINASYSLNGTLVTSETIVDAIFYPTSSFGLFDLNFSGEDTVSLYGAQAYDSSGNLISGTYAATIDVNASIGPPSGTGSGTVLIGGGSVPEPSSIVSGFFGLLGVSGVCLYHRRRQRA
jgi:hypothetical protein